ncbi:hypothetical protein [Streptomyces sp. CAU 1734]|uniref:hypothetical protein n=1 Tax=Streptomyces sp. CAU 1734 TaxID=3140360 RepID=UPI003260CFD6
MELHQLRTPADPGFRLDLDGTARFVHEGYTVTVEVRWAEPDDGRYYSKPTDHVEHDVVLTGTVELEGVGVGASRSFANERDAHSMREAMEEVVRDAVDSARYTVARLSARVEETDRKYGARQP